MKAPLLRSKNTTSRMMLNVVIAVVVTLVIVAPVIYHIRMDILLTCFILLYLY